MLSSPAEPKEQLDIVYRDDHLVAVNKPAGLLVHRSNIDRHETRFALQILRDQLGRRVYPVHRLDKPTSGLLVFALDRVGAARLSASFGNGDVAKRYWAVVRGYTDEQGRVDHALKEPHDALDDPRGRRDKPAQAAVTDYRRLATVELPLAVGRYATARYSLVEATPRHGRRHQIRRHMKHLSHPIIGDTTYGNGAHNRLFREQFGCQRLLLAAVGCVVPHPADGHPLDLQAPLEPAFARVLAALNWPTDPQSSKL